MNCLKIKYQEKGKISVLNYMRLPVCFFFLFFFFFDKDFQVFNNIKFKHLRRKQINGGEKKNRNVIKY